MALTEQQLEDRIMELPDGVAEVFLSQDTVDILEQLANRYTLTEAGIEELEIETMLVLIGEKHVDDFELNLKIALEDAPEDIVSKLAHNVHTELFEPIMDELKAVSDKYERFSDETETAQTFIETNKPIKRSIQLVDIPRIESKRIEHDTPILSLTPQEPHELLSAPEPQQRHVVQPSPALRQAQAQVPQQNISQNQNLRPEMLEAIRKLRPLSAINTPYSTEYTPPAPAKSHTQNTVQQKPTGPIIPIPPKASILDQKLSGTTNIPKEEVKIEPKQKAPTSYTKDPYRESIE